MLTVYGRNTSSNVQAVMWTIGELGLEYERHDRGHAHGGLDTPEFLAMNPHGLIPVLTDSGGPAIFESGAIIRYLAARYGAGTLWLEDPYERAQVDMWADWIKHHLTREFTGGVFWALVRTPPSARNEAAIDQALDRVAREFLKVERHLAAHPYMSGARFGLADIMLGHMLYRYFDMDIPRADLPALAAYYAKLAERPAYREHVMVSYESLRAE